MSAILGFDPFQVVSEVAVISAVAITLLLAWKHRHRVMVAITGDDRIHGTSLDFVWFVFFNCCGCCTGDWTRCLTRCPCCPKRVRGANLVKLLGQCLGFTTYTVELKNIVVGDLPWDRRGDFYLCVECAANPPMMTSLAEGKLPKVVHFPEVITLRLRWSPLEEQVRITVRELNVLGSNDLCRAKIGAMSILDWTYDPKERIKRFEMKPSDQGIERETPAWLLVEFDQPSESRDLEHFHGNINTVRMATREGTYLDNPLNSVKHQYALLDSTGNPVQEPLEEELDEIAWIRWFAVLVTNTVHFWCMVLPIMYLIIRYYVYACYHRYVHLTMAAMNNASFPISSNDLTILVRRCHQQLDGTGADRGVACKPNVTEVLATCKGLEADGGYLQGQPRPSAPSPADWLGLEVPGPRCCKGVCDVRGQLQPFDAVLVGVCLLLLLLSCSVKWCMNDLVRRRKNAILQERADHSRSMQAEYRTRRRPPGA
mmetsp:Transcript_104886/g.325999  ORF Transcript_104886/g.325999 Transcript_104886/m.325999 type:complete len:484 (-) Transcript_104886:134-1585(-)